jgi:hypothetical protein
MKTFDKTKPYGTVHGETNGACYEQNGGLFDHDGNEVSPTVEETEDPDKPYVKRNGFAKKI